jgi:choline dehydrogenase-like flavoprotein
MKNTENTSSAQVLEKTQPEQYDLVILGDGTGSTLAAWTFASDGKRVAVVERTTLDRRSYPCAVGRTITSE